MFLWSVVDEQLPDYPPDSADAAENVEDAFPSKMIAEETGDGEDDHVADGSAGVGDCGEPGSLHGGTPGG